MTALEAILEIIICYSSIVVARVTKSYKLWVAFLSQIKETNYY